MTYIPNLTRTRAYPLDKDTELRAKSAAAISATTAQTAIALDVPEQCTIRFVLDHDAIGSVTPGTAEWDITLEISDDNSTFVAVRTFTLGAGAMTYETAITGPEMGQFVPEATHIRVNATKTGTPGNLTYGAFLTID